MVNFVCVSIVLSTFVTLITANSLDEAIEFLQDVKNVETCANIDIDRLPRYIEQQYNNIVQGDGKMIEEFACILGCIAKEIDLLDDSNTFDKKKIEYVMNIFVSVGEYYGLPDVIINPINDAVISCFETPTSYADPCIAAREATDCITTNIKNLYTGISEKK